MLNKVVILQLVNYLIIINLEDVNDTANFLFIVLAEGRELFDKIIEKTKLIEANAKLHLFQIAVTIKYLHFKKICTVLVYSSYELLLIVKITYIDISKLVDKTRLKQRSTAPISYLESLWGHPQELLSA